MPLELKLRGKSTRQSHGSAIFYVDITLRNNQSIEEALAEANRIDEQRQAAGFDQTALDQAARLGFANGAFEDNEEDGGTVVDEFFPIDTAVALDAPDTGNGGDNERLTSAATVTERVALEPLAAKLDAKTRKPDRSVQA